MSNLGESMMSKRYTIVMFDWGDTLMVDVPGASTPMSEWPEVRALDGATALLGHLKASGRRIMLVTSARDSDEPQIRAALARVGLEGFVERIYCFKNTGLPKSEALYRLILHSLNANAEQVVMIGDSFENDVLTANACGIQAIWFKPGEDDLATGARFTTVRSHQAISSIFQALDGPA
jgi:putative hydrolase of the HAD superfamily